MAVVGAVAGFLVLLVVLAVILVPLGVGEESPSSPSVSPATSESEPSLSPATSEPGVPPSRPPVTETATVTAPPAPVPEVTVTETVESEPTESSAEPEPADVFYENCDAARAAGAAPVYSGEPGYGPHLDRDGDGVACEW
ncbi:excalibur calcium-binding domain-containing protein [Streptomyces europaeiscabiei]